MMTKENKHKRTPLTVICAWCNIILKEGNPFFGVSHGICRVCAEKQKKIKNKEAN